MPRPVLIDANNLIVRNVMATALADLQANGVFTGGIYGSLNTMRKLVGLPDVDADRIYAFFDCGMPPRRKRLIPGYKDGRIKSREMMDPTDRENALRQIEQCFHLFQHLGVLCLSYRDREADDSVAAAVRVFAEQGVTPLVVSGDGDLLQTVRMGADVWPLTDGRVITHGFFEQEVGVPPDVYTLFRTLTGDSSDSIKGAVQCGPVRSAKLIREFIQENLNELPPKVTTLAVVEQFDALVAFLWRKAGGKQHPLPFEAGSKAEGIGLKKWEQAILTDAPRLRRVVQGIDLSVSFGPTERLAARLAVLPPVALMPFLQACKALHLGSVLGDPEGWLRPFRTVEQRRLAGLKKARV